MTNEDGEIKLSRCQYPISIKYVDCKPVVLTKLEVEGSNIIIIYMDLRKCIPKITGLEKYPIKVLGDTLLINETVYILDYKGCNKMQVIE
jgi:hypothetical protein